LEPEVTSEPPADEKKSVDPATLEVKPTPAPLATEPISQKISKIESETQPTPPTADVAAVVGPESGAEQVADSLPEVKTAAVEEINPVPMTETADLPKQVPVPPIQAEEKTAPPSQIEVGVSCPAPVEVQDPQVQATALETQPESTPLIQNKYVEESAMEIDDPAETVAETPVEPVRAPLVTESASVEATKPDPVLVPNSSPQSEGRMI